ncbi:MAG TPA: RNA repair domain-containing protein [Candidatus Thermoplasmatota archaeon]|nr:RNA repair domain-containing protein [Candidatus Thermoplasmatota archaeon]
MHGPREVLNELKWRDGLNLAEAEVWYVHRGAPGDTRIIRGDAVETLGPGAMEVRAPAERATGGRAHIPYHRVFRIDYQGKPLWERRHREEPDQNP